MIFNMIPLITAIIYIINNIIIFSFIFLFCLNKTSKATPLPERSPEIVVPKLIILSMYSCVINTLALQFGIKPISEEKIGPRTLLE